MNNVSRFLLSGFLFVSCTLQVYSQNECDQILSNAEAEFNAGHFYAIPSLLQKCLEQGLSKEQSVRAYLILCQAYLVIDDPIAADDSFLKLLQADPEFVANNKDHPIDIVYLSKKFTATPIFTPHFRLGVNTSFFRSIYSVSTEPYEVPIQRTIRLGVQAGGGVDWNINDNFSLCAEIDFATRGYKRVRNNIAGIDRQSVVASQDWFDLPVYLKYTKSVGKIRPFGYAGFAVNYLLSAKNVFLYTDNKPIGSQLAAEGPKESVTYQRNSLNRSWMIGGGVKYKIGRDFLYADLRYMGGLSNQVAEDKMYYQPPSNISTNQIGNPNYYLSVDLTRYRHVTDLFRIDNLSLSFGYIHPIYNPRRVKKANTKSVSRKIRKEKGDKK